MCVDSLFVGCVMYACPVMCHVLLLFTSILYRVFNNDCTPSTAKTSKTLPKLLLYYNSLNKFTLLCKVKLV